MNSVKPLQGTDLIECVQANAKLGLATVVQQCGYGEDVESFEQNLQQACQKVGINLHKFSDLLKDRQRTPKIHGLNIAPQTNSQL